MPLGLLVPYTLSRRGVTEIASYTTRIRLAAFQLEGEAQVWWNWAKTSKDLEAMTWAEFHDLFMGKYFSDTARHAKAQEFLELKMRNMTLLEYVTRFTELARLLMTTWPQT